MKHFKKLCTIIILLLISFIKANKQSFLTVVDTVTSNYSRSKSLSANFCHNNDSLLLLKQFSKNYYRVNFLLPSTDNTPFLRNVAPNIIVDLHCVNINSILELVRSYSSKADRMSLFTLPYMWIIYYKKLEIPAKNVIEKYFKNLNILVDSNIILAEFDECFFKLIKIFKLKINSTVLIENLGNWTQNKGLIINEMESNTIKRRRNLKGISLNSCLVITHEDSLNHLTDKRDRHIDSIAKVNYILVQHLSDMVNISLNYSIQSTWGYKDKHGDWNGMIGELIRKEADIGGTPLFLTIDRIEIIEYIAMTTPTKSKFIFREPKLSYITNVYTLPFHNSVWASTVALLFIISLILFIIIKCDKYKENYYDEIDNQNSSFTDVIFVAFGALCQQGTSSVPSSVPGRITTIFLFVSFMFLYTSYSANIVALLQSSSNSIQTLQDLLHSRLQVGVDDTVFNHFYFPNATEPVRRALYLEKVAPPGQKPKFYQIEEGISLMRRGLFAFHVETGAGYKIVGETFLEDEKCGLQEIQFLQVPDPWLAIQKNSSYKEMLKIG